MLRCRKPYSSGDIANKLGKSADWFYHHRPVLEGMGMPAPLPGPGQRRWDCDAIDLWLRGRGKGGFPANDVAAPPPADTIEEHQRELAAAYRRTA